MSDEELDGLMRKLHVSKRRGIIRSLLSGNDTLCFTTRQYGEKMFERLLELAKDKDYFWDWHEMARKQLKAEGMKEVSQDVWTLRDALELCRQRTAR